MMGTRSGDLDPGVLLHLMREKSFDHDRLDHAVNEQAGLLGVSGISSDMKILLEQEEREPRAAQAVELFCYQLRKHIGAMTAVLGGLDTLVFTGGIGEHAAAGDGTSAVSWRISESALTRNATPRTRKLSLRRGAPARFASFPRTRT